MDATQHRSVDVGETRARPGLALLLAVLSVPGSTLVWDLDVPVPGFWIGGPLAAAAIGLALRARREPLTKAGSGMTIAALVLAGLALAQMVVITVASLVS